MNLCDENEMRALLTRHGFNFKKSMGQNFLIDASVPRRIAELSGTDGKCGVLEIGPGVGCLTEQLSRLAAKVVSVELDSRLIPVLKETLKDCGNTRIINEDIAKTDIPRLVREEFEGLIPCVCANLPYNISTPLMTQLTEADVFERITVMVQKEFAEKICARPGNKDRCAFGIYVSYSYEPEILFEVPRDCFSPIPAVTSAVMRLEKRKNAPVDCDKELFIRTVKGAFALQKKTLVNSLASAFPDLGKDELTDIITGCGFDAGIRAKELTMEDFASVAREIERRTA